MLEKEGFEEIYWPLLILNLLALIPVSLYLLLEALIFGSLRSEWSPIWLGLVVIAPLAIVAWLYFTKRDRTKSEYSAILSNLLFLGSALTLLLILISLFLPNEVGVDQRGFCDAFGHALDARSGCGDYDTFDDRVGHIFIWQILVLTLNLLGFFRPKSGPSMGYFTPLAISAVSLASLGMSIVRTNLFGFRSWDDTPSGTQLLIVAVSLALLINGLNFGANLISFLKKDNK